MRSSVMVAMLPTRGAMLALPVLAVGCPGEDPPPDEPPAPVDLARVDAWMRVVEPQDDVFGPQEDVVCDDTMGYGLEFLGPDQVLEVKTDLCEWFTGAQPSLVAVAPGDTVGIRVFHYELVAPDPAEGYVALAIGGEIVWEKTVAIPGPSAFYEEEVVVDGDWPAGTELQFHVHNHGVNDWELVGVRATPTGEAD
jgi:hypothetical protein